MLFHRQKLLLGLLSALGGSVNATDFQKYLFLFSVLCEKDKSYDFVPYRYGCYSFQASEDKQRLIGRGYLLNDTRWVQADAESNYRELLTVSEQEKIRLFVNKFGSLSGYQLIAYVYKKHPYFAINSEIASTHVSPDELKTINMIKTKQETTPIFATIGYEGSSVEAYLNKLIKNNITVLVDVRKNPLSRKYGFSKKTLSILLSKLNIGYLHFPELGIDSEDRQNLKTQLDYDRLFDKYEASILINQQRALGELISIYKKKKRIAITCFEKNHCECHRGRVANKIKLLLNGDISIIHL